MDGVNDMMAWGLRLSGWYDRRVFDARIAHLVHPMAPPETIAVCGDKVNCFVQRA